MIRLPTLHLNWNGIHKATAPDPAALAQLCHADIYRYALRVTGHIEDAEDVAAETFTAALAGLSAFKGNTEPRLWLLGIARRKLADRTRKRCRRPEQSLPDLAELPDTGHGPESILLSTEATELMRNLVLSLPDNQRQALLLQAAEGLSIAEIAKVMGRSGSSINSLLGRARAALRERGSYYFGDNHE